VTTTPGGCIRNDTFHIKEENKRKGIATNITSMFCLNDQTRDTAYLLTEIELPGDVFTVTGPGKVIKVDSINFKLLVAGRYKIEVLGANGCIDSSFFNVLDNRIFPKVTATTDTINCRTNMASLTGFSSDTSILSYWKNSKGDKFNSDLLKTDQAGIYTFISTNRYGCSDSTSIKVLVDTNQTTYQVFDDTLTCVKPKTTLVAIGDSINKKYSWTGPNNFTSNLLNPEINSSGQYVLKIESPNYCVSEYKINILEDKIIPKIIAQNGMLSCLVDSIQLQAQLKDHNGIFYWKDQFGNVFNPLNPFIKSAGIYTLFASNKNGCSDSLQITIDKDVRKPDFSINLDTLNCTKRQITINALSTFDSLSYSWTGPKGINSNLDKININSGGKYTIRITTNQNCFSEQSFEILEDTIKPIINIQSDTLDCLTTEIDLDFSSSVNIQLQNWMGPNNFNSNLPNIKINSGGIYTLTATADNFCTSQIQVNIIQDTIRPDLITNLDSLNCLKTEIDLKAISKAKPITFEWTLTDKMKVNSANIKTSVPGIYKIKATGSNHCSNEQEIIVPIDTLHPLVTLNNDLINCIKKQAIINSTTQSNITKYSWSGPNQFSGNKSST
ncbi:MAG: hypothetical protein ABIO44_06755, partial [Saprospiraceae bacterium]